MSHIRIWKLSFDALYTLNPVGLQWLKLLAKSPVTVTSLLCCPRFEVYATGLSRFAMDIKYNVQSEHFLFATSCYENRKQFDCKLAPRRLQKKNIYTLTFITVMHAIHYTETYSTRTSGAPTPTQLTPTLTHTHPYSHSPSLTLNLTYTHSHSHSLSLTLIFTVTHAFTLT